jgi:hypothetical protein
VPPFALFPYTRDTTQGFLQKGTRLVVLEDNGMGHYKTTADPVVIITIRRALRRPNLTQNIIHTQKPTHSFQPPITTTTTTTTVIMP